MKGTYDIWYFNMLGVKTQPLNSLMSYTKDYIAPKSSKTVDYKSLCTSDVLIILGVFSKVYDSQRYEYPWYSRTRTQQVH